MSNDFFNKDRVLDRVRKMMALVNDAGASEGERDNAMRMAHATLAKYNLSMAEAEAHGKQEKEKRGPADIKSRSRPWIRSVMQAVAHLFFCEYFYTARGNDQWNYFVGKESNVITAIEIAKYVVDSIVREGGAKQRAGGYDGAWRVSFSKGAAFRVTSRCRALRADQENATRGTGTSLVLADLYTQEQSANEKYISDVMGQKLVVKGSRTKAPGHGFHEGAEFGDKVGLHRQVGATKQQALK